MSRPCISHHHACDCLEQNVAVLIKAALDSASELDSLQGACTKDPHAAPISGEESARLRLVVERVYDACEQLGAKIGEAEGAPQQAFRCKRADGGADCYALDNNPDACDNCSSAIRAKRDEVPA
jgi:hypothetical protein